MRGKKKMKEKRNWKKKNVSANIIIFGIVYSTKLRKK